MALKTYNPVTPGQRQLVIVDRSTLHKGPPVKSLTEGSTRRVAATITGASRRVSAAAATSRLIGGSISVAGNSMCRRPSSGWNMIRTARPSSR